MHLVKFGDRIHTAADRGFTKVQPKGTHKMNFSHLSAAEKQDIAKKINAMSDSERRDLIDQLTKTTFSRLDARAEADANLKNATLTRVVAELGRLGFASDGIRASSKKLSVYEIDRAAKAANWHLDQRMALKSDMARLGMLAE
jgi:hypothetical protein